jgi:uncharacterized protein (DUF486 family)
MKIEHLYLFCILHFAFIRSHMSPLIKTILLLTISNAFMTIAWYGHLRFEKTALWKVILISWGIASLEYCFQVPANRIGFLANISPGQLKVIQEVITLIVFVIFARLWLGEKLTWNYYAAFGCILGAVFFVFYFRGNTSA